MAIPLSNNVPIDVLITIIKWLERQDRPGPTDDQPLVGTWYGSPILN